MLELDSNESLAKKPAPEEERQRHDESELALDLEEERKISLAREGLYSFLSRAFLFEIDNEFLTMVVAAQPILDSLASSQEGAALKIATEQLAAASSKMAGLEGTGKKKLLTDLAIEFASLFLVESGGREMVWPWESAYFTSPPRKFAEPYHEVCDAYRSVKYEKPKESKEPEDHIALELDFMAHLCRLTSASIDDGKVDFALGYMKLQKEFLADHLLRWAGRFSERLTSKSQNEFYRAMAMLLGNFIALDGQTVDHIAVKLEEIRGGNEEGSESRTVVTG